MENDTINRIGFWKRLAAYLLDLLVFCIVGTLFLLSLRFANWDEIPTDNTMDTKEALLMFYSTTFELLARFTSAYLPIMCMEILMGQSPGKLMLGIKIANADGTKASMGILTARAALKYSYALVIIIYSIIGWENLIRWVELFYIINLVTFSICGVAIGCFVALVEPRQSLMDMAVKTAVFKKSDIQ